MGELMTHARRFLLLVASMAAVFQATCFVNDGEECAGNSCSQDPGKAQTIAGNLLVSADGSMAVTALQQTLSDGTSLVRLLGVSLPDGALVPGPVVEAPEVPSLLLTPDVHRAWLARSDDGVASLAPFDLATMSEGGALPLEAGRYRAPLAGPLGGWLSLIEQGAAGRAETAIHLVRTADGAAFDVASGGLVYDARLTRDEGRLVAFVLPSEFLVGDTAGATVGLSTYEVRAWALAAGGPSDVPGTSVRLENFEPNLLGYLAWAVRLSPDGRWAAVSGQEKVGEHVENDPETGAPETVDDLEQVTALVDLDEGRLHARLRCGGPVAFTPDSGTLVGFRYVPAPSTSLGAGGEGTGTELVFVDVGSLAETAAEVPYVFPVYYVTPAGDLVVTYGLLESDGEHRVTLTSLDTGESTASEGPALGLAEFAVSADGRTMFAVDGGALYALGLYDGRVTELEGVEYAADNVSLLPDGDTLLVTREKTSLLDLRSLASGRVTRTVTLW